MKKRILLIGGKSKIAQTFVKKYYLKYQMDITIHKNIKINPHLSKIKYYQLNLADEASIENFINKTRGNKYDGLLFFASVYSVESKWNKMKFISTVNINFISYLDLIFNLKFRANSKIICLTDEGLVQPKKNHFYYSFSKALLEVYIRLLAVELAQTTSVIGIGLGPTKTRESATNKTGYYSRSLVSVKNPCEGFINLIDFILSENNFYSTGKIIPFDGGTYIKRTI